MKTLLLLLALAAAAVAQQPAAKPAEPPKPAPTVKQLPKEVALSVQNISLRLQLIRTQFAAVEAARQSLVRELCTAQGFVLETCEVDENAGTVSGQAAKPEKPAK